MKMMPTSPNLKYCGAPVCQGWKQIEVKDNNFNRLLWYEQLKRKAPQTDCQAVSAFGVPE
jgi:hypothetical protein